MMLVASLAFPQRSKEFLKTLKVKLENFKKKEGNLKSGEEIVGG